MALSLTSSAITQLQALVNNIGVANRQMVNVGGKLYYITKRFIPFNTADGFAVAYGSDTTGLVWSLLAAIGTGPNSPGGGSATEFSVAAIGTKIYLIDYGSLSDSHAGVGSPNFKLRVWTFDTVAGSWSGPGAGGPFSSDTTAVAMTALNSGTLLVVYTVASDAFGNSIAFRATTYNPGTDTWGTSFTVDGAASTCQSVAQIHDPTTDKTVVFYNRGGTSSLFAVVMNATPSLVTTTAAIFTFGGAFQFIGVWGLPTITTDSNSGSSSVAFLFVVTGVLRIVFIDLSTFAVATEIVDDGTDLPASQIIQQYSAQSQPGWSALDFAGTLYTLFTVDNGDLNNASSQSFLYAKARTGGSWTGLQNLFTSVISREMLTPFPAPFNTNGPAIIVQLFDPTKDINNDLTGLTSFILLPNAATPPATLKITLRGVKRRVKPTDGTFEELPEPVPIKRVM